MISSNKFSRPFSYSKHSDTRWPDVQIEPTFRIVLMNTELAFERHRKVVLGLVFSFALVTARTIAGCCERCCSASFQVQKRQARTTGMIFSAPSICSLVPPLAWNSRRDMALGMSMPLVWGRCSDFLHKICPLHFCFEILHLPTELWCEHLEDPSV